MQYAQRKHVLLLRLSLIHIYGNVACEAVKTAIRCGYRHIDTATAYRNEESVGRGIRESGVPREELFITTKLHNHEHSYKEALAAFDASMKRLGLDYLDLYLIHWPNPVSYTHLDVYKRQVIIIRF